MQLFDRRAKKTQQYVRTSAFIITWIFLDTQAYLCQITKDINAHAYCKRSAAKAMHIK